MSNKETHTNATATSTGNTTKKKSKLKRDSEKKRVDTRINVFSTGNTRRCSSSKRRVFAWRPWANVVPLVGWLKKHGFSVNAVLNEAFLDWVGGFGDEELRLRARLYRLLDEERELRQRMRVVLRSGAFLGSYARKLLKGGNVEDAKLGRKPLDVLASGEEVEVVKRMLARRKAIVKEVCAIEARLLPDGEYVLKGERKRRRRKPRGRRVKTEYELPDGSKAVVHRFEPSKSRRQDKKVQRR